MNGIVISLCDYTGAFVKPWTDAGHRAILVDPQHGITHTDGPVTRLALTVEEALPQLGDLIRGEHVVMVAGWPPCTALSGSGARWWADKRNADYMFQAKAVAVAEQCRTIGQLSGPAGFARAVFAANRPDRAELAA